jgi:hypothetical protein
MAQWAAGDSLSVALALNFNWRTIMGKKLTATGVAGAVFIALNAQFAQGEGNPLDPRHYAGQPATATSGADAGNGSAYAFSEARNPLHPSYPSHASGFEGTAKGEAYVDKNNPMHPSYNSQR